MMSPSVTEFALVIFAAAVLLGWTFWRYRVARLIAVVVILANVVAAVARAESSAAPSGEKSSATQTASDDGDRDWGRDDGIATQLTTRSKLVVGGVFLVVLAGVVAVVFYRRPDGSAYPDDEG